MLSTRPSNPPGWRDFRSSAGWGHSGDKKPDAERRPSWLAEHTYQAELWKREECKPPPPPGSPNPTPGARVPGSTSYPDDSPPDAKGLLAAALPQVAKSSSYTRLYFEDLVGSQRRRTWARASVASQLEGDPSCLGPGARPGV